MKRFRKKSLHGSTHWPGSDTNKPVDMRSVRDPHASTISPHDPRVALPIPKSAPLLRKSVVVPLLALLGGGLLFALQMGVGSFSTTPKEQSSGESTFAFATPRQLEIVSHNPRSSKPINRVNTSYAPLGPTGPGEVLPPSDQGENLLPPSSSSNPPGLQNLPPNPGAPIFFSSVSPSSYGALGRSEVTNSPRSQENPFLSLPSGEEVVASTAQPSPYEVQNMQSQKSEFLEHAYPMGDLIIPEILPREQTIYPGTLIPIALVTGIHTDLPGVVIARVTAPIYDSSEGDTLLIPAGSTLTGRYDSQISYGQRRVLIIWDTLVRRDGIALALGNMPGVDLQGMAGAEERVSNHFLQKLGAVALSTLVDLGAYELRYQVDQRGVNPDVTDGFGESAQSGVQKNQDFAFQRQPTIEITPGSALRVVVTAPLVLPRVAE